MTRREGIAMSMLEDRENTRRVELASGLLAAIAGDDPWKGATAWFAQFTEGRDKVAQSHMYRVKKAERELLDRRRALEESPPRFWLEYDPMGIYPEGGALGAEFWLRVDCAATLFSVAAAGDDDRRNRCVWPLDRAGKRLLKNSVVDGARNRERKRWAVQSVETAAPLLCGLSELAQAIQGQIPRQDGGRLVVGWGGEPLSLGATAAVLMEALEAAALDKSEQNRGLVSWGGMSSVSMVWAAAETLRAAQAVGRGALTPAQGAERLRPVERLMAIGTVVRDDYDKRDGRFMDQLNNLGYIPLGVGLGVEALSWVAQAVHQDGCPGAEPQWVDLAEAIRGAELLADYAGENLIPEIGEQAGRHLDELMEYAVRLEQDGVALADGAKEGTGADG